MAENPFFMIWWLAKIVKIVIWQISINHCKSWFWWFIIILTRILNNHETKQDRNFVKKLQQRVNKDPGRPMRRLAEDIGVKERTIRRYIKLDIHYKSCKMHRGSSCWTGPRRPCSRRQRRCWTNWKFLARRNQFDQSYPDQNGNWQNDRMFNRSTPTKLWSPWRGPSWSDSLTCRAARLHAPNPTSGPGSSPWLRPQRQWFFFLAYIKAFMIHYKEILSISFFFTNWETFYICTDLSAVIHPSWKLFLSL